MCIQLRYLISLKCLILSWLESVYCRLEQESGFYFNMRYFEEKVLAGEWDEVEKYLSGYTKVDDNRYSMKIFFEIRKQKYLEALDRYFGIMNWYIFISLQVWFFCFANITIFLYIIRQDKSKAVDILVNDLKVFSTFNEDLYKEITQLLTLSNFR